MTNLDDLKSLLASATPGEWASSDDAVPWQPGQGPFDERGAGISVPRPRELIKKSWYERTVTVVEGGMQDEQGGAVGVLRNEDAALIVSLHNAAPSLIAELEAARAVCELITLWAGVEMTTLHPDIAKALRNWKKARGEG